MRGAWVVVGASALTVASLLAVVAWRGRTPAPPPAAERVVTAIRHASEGDAHAPSWSADGEYLAFRVGPEVGGGTLHWIRAGQPIPKVVGLPGAPDSGDAGSPSWHPAGFVVFAGDAGRGRRLFFAQPPNPLASELLTQADQPGALTDPVVSADGYSLAFLATEGEAHHVSRWSPIDGRSTTLMSGLAPFSAPAVSAEGELVAVAHMDEDWDLWVHDRRSGERQRVAGGPGDQRQAAFTPDGTAVLYFDDADGAWDLMRCDLEGGVPTRLAEDVELPSTGGPALSPDGALAVVAPAAGSEIWLVDIEGEGLRRIHVGVAAPRDPALTQRPGGEVLAFTARGEGESRQVHLVALDDQS